MRTLVNLALTVALTAAIEAAPARAADPVPIGTIPVVTGLSSPVGLVHAGDGSGRLFVVEQDGTIEIVRNRQRVSQPFLDVRDLVSCCNERGLLGLAFHPDYANNGFAFINYTDRAGDTVVARYRVDPQNRDRLDPASAVTVLEIDQPFSNHNGGHLAFGPDGYLYIGLGDGGSGGDPGNRAQNMGVLLGKMLRIDVDTLPYRVPITNPFATSQSIRPEIWASGLRNPWRYSFDRLTGDLWIADVGQNEWEEVNVQTAASTGGENYGWRLMEGSHCFNPSTNCKSGSLVLPVAEYSHEEGCSVTGGYVYRGRNYRSLRGAYLYGDLCSGRIWATSPAGNGTFTTQLLLDTDLTITSFGEDEAGELYVVDYGGTVYALVGTSGRRERPVRTGG
jgi:glucose/arabinose dehydrogenase